MLLTRCGHVLSNAGGLHHYLRLVYPWRGRALGHREPQTLAKQPCQMGRMMPNVKVWLLNSTYCKPCPGLYRPATQLLAG